MRARIVIEPGGKLSVFTEEGSFEQGKAKIENLLQLLQGKGVAITSAGQVESHKHDEIAQENKVSQETPA